MTRVIEEFFGFEFFFRDFLVRTILITRGLFTFSETEDDPGCLECC